jgi:hypothetical protein
VAFLSPRLQTNQTVIGIVFLISHSDYSDLVAVESGRIFYVDESCRDEEGDDLFLHMVVTFSASKSKIEGVMKYDRNDVTGGYARDYPDGLRVTFSLTAR